MLKKIKIFILGQLSIVFILILSMQIFAKSEDLKVTFSDVKIFFDNYKINFYDKEFNEISPVKINDTIYVPLDSFLQSLPFQKNINEKTNEIYIVKPKVAFGETGLFTASIFESRVGVSKILDGNITFGKIINENEIDTENIKIAYVRNVHTEEKPYLTPRKVELTNYLGEELEPFFDLTKYDSYKKEKPEVLKGFSSIGYIDSDIFTFTKSENILLNPNSTPYFEYEYDKENDHIKVVDYNVVRSVNKYFTNEEAKEIIKKEQALIDQMELSFKKAK